MLLRRLCIALHALYSQFWRYQSCCPGIMCTLLPEWLAHERALPSCVNSCVRYTYLSDRQAVGMRAGGPYQRWLPGRHGRPDRTARRPGEPGIRRCPLPGAISSRIVEEVLGMPISKGVSLPCHAGQSLPCTLHPYSDRVRGRVCVLVWTTVSTSGNMQRLEGSLWPPFGIPRQLTGVPGISEHLGLCTVLLAAGKPCMHVHPGISRALTKGLSCLSCVLAGICSGIAGGPCAGCHGRVGHGHVRGGGPHPRVSQVCHLYCKNLLLQTSCQTLPDWGSPQASGTYLKCTHCACLHHNSAYCIMFTALCR